MKFISLRGQSQPCSISEAILGGLASDGGLLVPDSWPQFKVNPAWANLDFYEFAALILAPFFAGDALATRLNEICRRAFDFAVPLKNLDQSRSILELFHGPTGAFKDFGARFLALCCDAIPDPRAKDRLVLVATSGDTGGAVAAAFFECTKIPVGILYPKNGVSFRQEKQLTVWGDRVRAFSVHGSFDDCQSIVKQALAEGSWKTRYQLISANSINLGRLLPQMAYFAYASLKYKVQHGIDPIVIIPSGNMGNATAALWALYLGFPLRKVLFTHNANRAVPNYFDTSVWNPQATIPTIANAMDVGNPSNFERVRKLFASDVELKKVASAISVSDEEICRTIKAANEKWGEVVCPHTATAIFAGLQLSDANWIAVATAHPAKFESIIEPLLGKTIAIPENLQLLLSRPGKNYEIEATLRSLEKTMGTWAQASR